MPDTHRAALEAMMRGGLDGAMDAGAAVSATYAEVSDETVRRGPLAFTSYECLPAPGAGVGYCRLDTRRARDAIHWRGRFREEPPISANRGRRGNQGWG